jgi:Repeat of unknown function (DUF5648)
MRSFITRLMRAGAFSVGLGALVAGCGSGSTDVAAVATSDGVSEKAVGSLVPIYRFARISNGAYFYTSSSAEANAVRTTNSDFRYEGVAFNGYSSGGQTVFRFANLTNGGYFFTASVAERDYVLNHPVYGPRFRLDTATFQVALDSDTTALPIYRIANRVNGAYLYTTSLPEVSYAVNTLAVWNDEGLKFRVPPATPSLATFAGRYSGTYSGAESGTFDVQVTEAGTIVGTGYSNTYKFTFPATGTISASGNVNINVAAGTAGSSNFSGGVGLDYKINGSWAYTGSTSGGTFTGQRIP